MPIRPHFDRLINKSPEHSPFFSWLWRELEHPSGPFDTLDQNRSTCLLDFLENHDGDREELTRQFSAQMSMSERREMLRSWLSKHPEALMAA